MQSLTQKIDIINQTGFLDASVLGEVVTPRDFNTLRRIADEDDTRDRGAGVLSGIGQQRGHAGRTAEGVGHGGRTNG